MKKFNKLFTGIFIAVMLFGVASIASATSYYNWGNSDETLLHQRVFDTVLGHDHDGTNSKPVTGLGNSVVVEGATADAYEATVAFADPTADNTLTVPDTVGAVGTFKLQGATVVITAGTGPTLTVPVAVDFIATDTITTDNQDQTITFSAGGSVGQRCTLVFTTDSGGAGDEVITLHTTLTSTTGTLTLANLTAGVYSVSLVSNGTIWVETGRTGAQT